MRSLDRLITLLEAVGESQSAVKPVQAAARAGLSLSTASRFLRELANTGLLERTDSGSYVLGQRLVAIARAAAQDNPLIRHSLPEMEVLRDETGETVSLHVRSGDKRVCVAEIQSHEPVRRVVPLGLTLPLHTGATGWAILAFLDETAVHDYFAAAHVTRQERAHLQKSLSKVRRDRIAMAQDAWQKGIAGSAAPVFDSGRVLASLSVSGPGNRWTPRRMSQHAEAIRGAAQRISAELAAV